jgi:hypothetical protein
MDLSDGNGSLPITKSKQGSIGFNYDADRLYFGGSVLQNGQRWLMSFYPRISKSKI